MAPTVAAIEVVPGLFVLPRQAWGADLPPKKTITPEDVRFVLVHHTGSSNRVPNPAEVIRATYAWQTSPTKGWADVCYHFFVAPDGSIWEGRAGSIDGPVLADASGGNQGWAQLVCLIGDFRTTAPTAAAQASVTRLLAWITWRYRLDRDPAATITYESRGSDRWPAGTMVTTAVISGHRDATHTTCPGDAAYALLQRWREAAAGVPDPVFPHPGPHPPADRLARVRPPGA